MTTPTPFTQQHMPLMPSSRTQAEVFIDTQNVSPYEAPAILANILGKEDAAPKKFTLVGDERNTPWVAFGRAQAKKAVDGTECRAPEVEHIFLSGNDDADSILGKKLYEAVKEANAQGVLSRVVFVVLSSDNDFRKVVEGLRRLGARIVGGNAVFPPSFYDQFYLEERPRSIHTKRQSEVFKFSKSKSLPEAAASAPQRVSSSSFVARENYDIMVKYKCELEAGVVQLESQVAVLREREREANERCAVLENKLQNTTMENAFQTALLAQRYQTQDVELEHLRTFKQAAYKAVEEAKADALGAKVIYETTKTIDELLHETTTSAFAFVRSLF